MIPAANQAAIAYEPLDVLGCPLAGIRQVEASAGTGKTWSLCGLYLRLLLERQLRVQDILVVTFTNAATAELRERIRARLVDTLARVRESRVPVGTDGLSESRPAAGSDAFIETLLDKLRASHSNDELAAHVGLALASFDEAAIFTIHGFCQRALADAPFTARMPLALELAQDDTPWAAEAAQDFWRRHVATETADPALVDTLAAYKDTPERYAALLRRHLSKPLACVRWPEPIEASAGTPSELADRAHATASAMWLAQRDRVVALMDAAVGRDLNASTYRPEAVRKAIEEWDAFARHPGGIAALACDADRLSLFTPARLQAGTKKNQTIPMHPFFEHAENWQRTLAALDLRRIALLRRLVDEGPADVRAAKRSRHVVGFDDLLANLHDRLLGPQGAALAGALAARFPAALIDEFQDTDPQQFAIFHTLYAGRPGPLFFIGDPKQAIYSFRNADLQTYLAAQAAAQSHASLIDNQRSTPALIDALNHFFGANPHAFMLKGLNYQPVRAGSKPRATLRDHRPGAAAAAALQVWMLPPGAGCDDPLPRRDAMQAAIASTASDIARLLEASRRGESTLGRPGAPLDDRSHDRPLAAGDIAVLVRSNAHGSQMRHALLAMGIASVELAQASVFASVDAEELDRVLAAVLEPARERLLKAALSTQAMGWDAARIETLSRNEDVLLAEVQRFAAWRDAWFAHGIGFMARRWMSEAGVAARMLRRPDGERRLTNLLHLVERLHEEAVEHPAPQALLRWLQRLRAQGSGPTTDESAQLRLESDRHLVQIVTVHKSKGLEYPIVYCPLLWVPPPPRRTDSDSRIYHDRAGTLVIDYRRAFLDKDEDQALAACEKLEAAAEDLRLIYVALTRAVHRCVLVAGCCTERTSGKPSVKKSTHSLLNWLVAGTGMTPAQWLEHDLGPDAVMTAWRQLAARSGGTISLAPLPAADAPALPPERRSPERIEPLALSRPIPLPWRVGSFSGMAHGASREDAARERDARPVPDAVPAGGDDAAAAAGLIALDDDDILRFPRGPAAGECIHEVFERMDFADPSTWPAAIEAALRAWRTLQSVRTGDVPAGFETPSGTLTASSRDEAGLPHAAMLLRMAAEVLATPLPLGTPTPLRLDTLPSTRRLSELEFHLEADRLDPASLNGLLSDEHVPVPRLSFSTLRGFVKGYVDLVFEHEGRWFVLDWKSNHLGNAPAGYAVPALARVMQAQAYHLQALLYQLALDRLLRTRLPGYDPARHLGGAVYLFVRGMRPGWRDAHAYPTGVFIEPPRLNALHRLSRLLGRPEAMA